MSIKGLAALQEGVIFDLQNNRSTIFLSVWKTLEEDVGHGPDFDFFRVRIYVAQLSILKKINLGHSPLFCVSVSSAESMV